MIRVKDYVELPDGSKGQVIEAFKTEDKLSFYKIRKDADGSVITVDQTKVKLIKQSGSLLELISRIFK